jgi:hypothetical protein
MIGPEVVEAVRAAVVMYRDVALAKGLRFDDENERSFVLAETAVDWLIAHVDVALRDRLPERYRLVTIARAELDQLAN